MTQVFNRLQPLYLVLTLLAAVTLHAQALPLDIEQEISISSDTASLDKLQGQLVYTGNVELKQGSLWIQANQITLTKNQDGVQQFIATGKPARYEQVLSASEGKTQAYGETLIYNLVSDELTLLKNAGLEKQGNAFTGDKIIYLINEQRVKADSVQQERVRMTIQPKTNKEP